MKINDKNSTDRVASLLPQFLEAGFAGNTQQLELLSLKAIRTLRGEYPQLTDSLGIMLAKFSVNNASLRWHNAEPPPVDSDAGLELLQVIPAGDAMEPILMPSVQGAVTRFLGERAEAERLIREGIFPPRSLLLKGPPGTGKTMLAKWLACKLNMPFVVLDLATSISSFLGKTGSNLRRSLDYARATPCLLLLDEFDSIAKRRDDATEIGELKRIVNVLLKELEDWPLKSVLVAATNHPDLLDPAIHRRFDVVFEMPMPGQMERESILLRSVGRFAESLKPAVVTALSQALDGCNCSEVDTLTQGAVRRHLIEGISLPQALVVTVLQRLPDLPTDEFGRLVRTLKEVAGLSVREIAELVGKGSSTIQYHLTKKDFKRKGVRHA